MTSDHPRTSPFHLRGLLRHVAAFALLCCAWMPATVLVLCGKPAALAQRNLRHRRAETRVPMPDLHPLRFLLVTFSGWINRQQAQAIDYLAEENRVLREQLGKRRLRLTDDQRRRLAAKGKALGRRMLRKVATIVTPDTILRWHRLLVAAKHTYPHKGRVGRPGIMKAIRQLIVRMATENASWGYCRIQGEMKKLGHRVGRTTIAKALKDSGARATRWAASQLPPFGLTARVPEKTRIRAPELCHRSASSAQSRPRPSFENSLGATDSAPNHVGGVCG